MVSPLWAAGVLIPGVIITKLASGRGKQKSEDDGLNRMLGDEGGDPSFVCERVCTSNRLMRRMGSLAKDVTTDTCVTVCGTSSEDACIEACQKAVCSNMHQVPAWNEGCLSRCTAECRRKR